MHTVSKIPVNWILMAPVEIWWAMQPHLRSLMHYTNMKVAENCCVSSCNLLSQGRFNGNLSHAFQIHFHLLYKMTSEPVPISLYTIFRGFNIPLNHFISTWPQTHQLAIPETTLLHAQLAHVWSWDSDLRLGNSPSHPLHCSPTESAGQIITASWSVPVVGGSRSPVVSLCLWVWTSRLAIPMMCVLSYPDPSVS